MGVPAFFRYLTEKYPKILVRAKEEHERPGKPVDASQPNPNGYEFDNLYLDMNGLIHPCTHPEGEEAPPTEEEMYLAIFRYLDRLFNLVRPRKLVFMAIDGVAPRAKMNQQRSRRFRSAQEAAEIEETRERVRKEMIDRGQRPPAKSKPAWDSNVITPGTEFMSKLSDWLRFYIAERINRNPAFKNVRVILSDAQSPGEGEHKLMQFIRRQRAEPGYDPNTTHCMYGLDADLIMLGLASHEIHFTILREEVLFGKAKKQKETMQAGYKMDPVLLANGEVEMPSEAMEELGLLGTKKKPFDLVRLWILREYLAYEFRPETFYSPLPFAYNLEACIDDFVFICFFVGNDFLPHLPSLSIREGGLELLLDIYKRVLPTVRGYLTQEGKVNLERVDVFMSMLGMVEDEIFARRRRKELADKRRKEDRARTRRQGGQQRALGAAMRDQAEAVDKGSGGRSRKKRNQEEAPDFAQLDNLVPLGRKNQQNRKDAGEAAPTAAPAPDKVANKSVAAELRAKLAGKAATSKAGEASESEGKGAEKGGEAGKDKEQEGGKQKESVKQGGGEEQEQEQEEKEFMPSAKASSSSSSGDNNEPAVGSKRGPRDELDEIKPFLKRTKLTKWSKFKNGAEEDENAQEDDAEDAGEDGATGADDGTGSHSAAKEEFDRIVKDHTERSMINEDVQDEVRLGEAGWKNRYYASKFGPKFSEPNSKERREVIESYVTGLCWVMEYYYKGVQSWRWYYPFHYAPMASDLINIDRIKIEFPPSAPFKPVDQLMGVLPPASAHALPVPCRWYMTNEDSSIADFYPLNFDYDQNGKPMKWLWIALLPFIDEKRLLAVTRKLEAEFSDKDKKRNECNPDLIFSHVEAKGTSEMIKAASEFAKRFGRQSRDEGASVAAIADGETAQGGGDGDGREEAEAAATSSSTGNELALTTTPTTAGDVRGGSQHSGRRLLATDTNGIAGYFLPPPRQCELKVDGEVPVPSRRLGGPLPGNKAVCFEFRLPEMRPHLSRVLAGVKVPPASLTLQDLNVRPPRMGGMNVGTLMIEMQGPHPGHFNGVPGAISAQGLAHAAQYAGLIPQSHGGPPGGRTWGSNEPRAKQRRGGRRHNQQPYQQPFQQGGPPRGFHHQAPAYHGGGRPGHYHHGGPPPHQGYGYHHAPPARGGAAGYGYPGHGGGAYQHPQPQASYPSRGDHGRQHHQQRQHHHHQHQQHQQHQHQQRQPQQHQPQQPQANPFMPQGGPAAGGPPGSRASLMDSLASALQQRRGPGAGWGRR